MKRSNELHHIAIIVPAYNEEKNIKNLLRDLLEQDIIGQENIILKNIYVVSCSTDKTNQIVEEMSKKYTKVKLINERNRTGKAGAINLARDLVKECDILIVVSADIRLPKSSLNNLVKPFFKDSKIGLTTGSASVYPMGDKKMSFLNSFLWELLNSTNKYLSERNSLAHCFGELYAFKASLLKTLPKGVINEDSYIASMIKRLGYKVVYIEDAKVILRGPSTLHELLAQRARINRGHVIAITKYHVRPTIFSILLFTKPLDALKIAIHTLRKFLIKSWIYLPLLIILEVFSYFLQMLRPSHFSKPWDPLLSTKYEIKRRF